ncbi:MAG: 6,7-dimethyl-8-ribityllumazine synthase [bacterium]
MVKNYYGKLDARGIKCGIVISRFNEFIGRKLLDGAIDSLLRHQADENDLKVYWVPGAWEIPVIAQKLALKKEFDCIIALGAIIRGDTPHFDYIATEVTKGLAQASLKTDVPVSFGVITCDTLEQAIERAGTKGGNKGAQAAESAIEMVQLGREIDKKKK